MSATDTLDLRRCGLEKPTPCIIRLQRPVRHPVRHRRDRQTVARREMVVAIGALQGIDVLKEAHGWVDLL